MSLTEEIISELLPNESFSLMEVSFDSDELRGLLPLVSSPGFEDTSVEMSDVVTGSSFSGIELTSVEMSGFEDTNQSVSLGDDFVAGCGEWFGRVGIVQAYDSIITPPLTSSTMLEPVRVQPVHDFTMCEVVEDEGWLNSTVLLQPLLNSTTVEPERAVSPVDTVMSSEAVADHQAGEASTDDEWLEMFETS